MTKYTGKKLPENIQEYFDSIVQKQEGSRLLVVLDPKCLLKLDDKYIDVSGNEWKVYRYCENDLSFRLEYSQKPADPNFRHIIRVTYPQGITSGKINLSFIGDILEQSDEILDFDIMAILKQLLPGEIWPESSITQYELEVANKLGQFINNSIELRKIKPKRTPLNEKHIMALMLASRHIQLPLNKLLFDVSNLVELIGEYLYFVYSFELYEEEKNILKQLVKNCARSWERVDDWLEIDEVDLAFFLYSWKILQKYEIDNPLNQIKGWGVLGFDPEMFGEIISEVVDTIRKNETIWNKVVKLAEESTLEGTIKKIVATLSFKNLDQLSQFIQKEDAPMMVYGLCINFLERIVKEKNWQKQDMPIREDILSHFLLKINLPESKYLSIAQALLRFFQDINFIQRTLKEPIMLNNELVNFLDWYQRNQFYRLEFILSRCLQNLKVIDEKELRDQLTKYLNDYAKTNIHNLIQKLDIHLTEMIEKNWNEYTYHPRLSCNFVNDFVNRRSMRFSDERHLWLLILDGMRLDTWEEVVKPYLQERFEVLSQVLYISPLPSTTKIARTCLLAGCLPQNWKDYHDTYSTDGQILASRNFLLSADESKSKLHIVMRSETDYGQRKLDLEIKPYNILIYNLSDDCIHTFRGDIFQLNEVIKSYFEKNVLPDLVNRIGDNDCILVTSDHGFIELSKEEEIKVSTEEPNRVNYRYLDSIEFDKGFRIQYGKDEFFTLAKGGNWFGREKGGFSRYAHGGISLNEIVVPGVLMRKITQPIIAFEFAELIQRLEVIEDTMAEIEVVIKNSGNQESIFHLTIEPNIGKSELFTSKIPLLNNKTCSFKFKPSLELRRIQVILQYEDARGSKIRKINTIQIAVLEKKGKFQMDLSALDKLEMGLEKEKLR